MKWFTSDLHLNHVNLCRGTTKWDVDNQHNAVRDFDTVPEMNDAVINSINDNVDKDDTLYILGDFAFGVKSEIPRHRLRINCENIHFIYGNHDHALQDRYQGFFTSCKHYDEVVIRDKNGRKQGLVLFHYYIGGVWNNVGRGVGHLFGHSHGSLPLDHIVGKAFDVGWDVWKKPLNEHEVCDHLATLGQNVKWLDHHTDKTSYK